MRRILRFEHLLAVIFPTSIVAGSTAAGGIRSTEIMVTSPLRVTAKLVAP